jgi:hypothetical protein
MENKKIQYKAGVLGGVTQEQADKKNAELNTPTPTAPQTVAQEPTSLSQSSVAALLEANNARMAQKQAEVKAYQEAEDKHIQDLKDLRAQKGSFIGNYLASAEPKIDKDKEKRLQQVAKMKLLHDGLSALAKAYPAFIGKNAMGYYPTSTPSNIGKDIEELNTMRDAYVKERKAWQELGERYKVAQLDEQIASAEAALQSAQEAKARAYKDMEDIDKSYTDTLRDIYKQESANERVEANNNARQIAAAMRASGGGNSNNSDIDHEIVNWWTSMFPDMYTDTRTSSRQATSPAGTPIANQYIDSTVTGRRNLSKEEKAEITRKAGRLYKAAKEANLRQDEVVEGLKVGNKDAEKTAEIIEDYLIAKKDDDSLTFVDFLGIITGL